MSKHPAAVALGKLKRGVRERPSAKKLASNRVNVAKATAARLAKYAAAKSAATA